MHYTDETTLETLIENAIRGSYWGALLGIMFQYFLVVILTVGNWLRYSYPREFDVFALGGILINLLIPLAIVGGAVGFAIGLSNGIVLAFLSRLPRHISHKPSIYFSSVFVVMIAAFAFCFAMADYIITPYVKFRWSETPVAIANCFIAAAAAGFVYERRLRKRLRV